MATKPNGTWSRGFTTLAVTLILLSILMAVSGFIGKVLMSDRRITLNEIEYRTAMASAEQGIAEAVVALAVHPAAPAVSGSIMTSAAAGRYEVSMAASGVPHVSDIRASVSLDSGTAATISVQLAERGILNPDNSGPAAPLLVAGTMTANGTITMVANPNGGGPGVPVSIWAKGEVHLDGGATTCGLDEYHHGGCNRDNAYSHQTGSETMVGPDIVANDPAFPGDLVEYVFGEPDTAEGWARIESRATAILSRCDGPVISGGAGIFIVEKVPNCTLGSIGSRSAPVVLIIKDSHLTINADSRLYGLVFAYDSNPSDMNEYAIKINGGAELFGTLLANHSNLDLANGNYAAIYDPAVLCKIRRCDGSGPGGSPFVTIGYVPGSWKDWE